MHMPSGTNESTRLRVLMLLPVVGHPRDSKRIDMLQEAGASVEAAAFERDQPVKRAPRCLVTRLGRTRDGRYLSRALASVAAVFRVARLARRADIVYASGQDMALIGLLATAISRKPVVMEVGDLREIQFSRGLPGKIVRTLDRCIVRRCAFLVTTSEAFVTKYYEPLLQRRLRYMVMENKLDAGEQPRPARRKGEGPITLGYFGVLRAQWPIDVLQEVLVRAPDHFRLVLAGYATDSVQLEALLALPQVRYVGEYKSADLLKLYPQVDVVWGAYPVTARDGKRWARVNRFYEAGFFGKPIVVLRDTGDALPVRNLGIGHVLSDAGLEEQVREMLEITWESIAQWNLALDRLPTETFIYSSEPTELLHRLISSTCEPKSTALLA